MTTPSVALIFGAASGIGRETGYIFAERCTAIVVFADKNLSGAQAASEFSKTLTGLHAGYQTIALEVDTSSKTSVQSVVDQVVAQFGRIDYAVNSAGISGSSAAGRSPDGQPLVGDQKEEALLNGCFATNAKGIKYTTDIVSSVMCSQDEKFITGRGGKRSIGRGAIVNVLSINGIVPVPGQGHYGASKLAGIGFSNIAACGLAAKKSQVRVNAVLPSYSETEMLNEIYNNNPNLQSFAEKLMPTGKPAKAEEIGEVCYFLATPAASYIHGANVIVDAGLTLTRGLM